MKLIDSHCHLHDPEFFGELREEVYARAIAADIGMITVGTDERSSAEAVKFAETHDLAWAAVGVHPHDTQHGWASIRALAMASEKVVAIGEIGLDYFYNHSPRDIQIRGLEEQLQIAQDLRLPVSFHVREAFADFWPIFDNFPRVKGVLHSFTDSRANAEKGLARGLLIGVNGISTFTRDADQQELYRSLPMDKIIFETDAPFLTPKPLRGKMNEVGYVELVARWAATERGLSPEEVMQTSCRTTRTLFNV